MDASGSASIARGWVLFGGDGHRIGQVDASFADYLLVRTGGLLPVDLYVPRSAVIGAGDGRAVVGVRASEAYSRWHRPLKRAPHG